MRGYDALTGRLTGISTTKGMTLLQDNTYTFNALGNLTQRADNRLSQHETFQYDTLNRVIQVDTTVSGTTTTVTTAYDAKGNITAKSDVGSYTYGQVETGCTSGVAGPHAVTSISGTKNATYCYDANGNMTSGDGRTVTYTAFDKPLEITKGTSSAKFFWYFSQL